eukprot:1157869-Pelagomonas_calceolata.AAC.12
MQTSCLAPAARHVSNTFEQTSCLAPAARHLDNTLEQTSFLVPAARYLSKTFEQTSSLALLQGIPANIWSCACSEAYVCTWPA